MIERADAILKLALAIAAVTIGLSISYYYAIFLPGQAMEAVERERMSEEKRAEKELTEKREQSEAKEAAKLKYETCISEAQADYVARWDASCARLHKEELAVRNRCEAKYSDSASCSALTVRPAQDCALPNAVSKDYDEGHKRSEERCLSELKAGM